MILTAAEIASKNLVHNGAGSNRATTFDATVGLIVQSGRQVKAATFTLPPRGIVWVISKERFHLPDTITGLATLRTTWTHQGVLALNVGIIDPGWEGPLATALVNLSNSDFDISIGDPFFRVLFNSHAATGATVVHRTDDEYRQDILGHSRVYGKTFLAMDTLVSEVSDKVLGLPRFVYWFTVAAVAVALIAIFAPISFSVWTDYEESKPKIEQLQRQIDGLKADKFDRCRLAKAEQRIALLSKTPGPPLPSECR
jgi:dUTPase